MSRTVQFATLGAFLHCIRPKKLHKNSGGYIISHNITTFTFEHNNEKLSGWFSPFLTNKHHVKGKFGDRHLRKMIKTDPIMIFSHAILLSQL